MGSYSPVENVEPDSSISSLKICIVGAGMGGLTTALALARRGFQHVHVYEYAPDLGFVGAGIQMAPNMARVLDNLGVWEEISREAVVLNETSIREGSTDRELAHVDLRNVKKDYEYEHMVGHRSALATGIFEGCKRYAAVQFHFGTQVDELDVVSDRPSFRVRNKHSPERPDERVSCDILLGADGIKSNTRAALLKHIKADAEIVDTNTAAYRIMLTREQMASDPALLELIDSDKVVRWIGEKRHIIAYPVSSKEIYNLSTTQPDTHFAAAPSASYTTRGSKAELFDVFDDYCPMIKKMLDLVPEGEVCEWKLRVHAPLPTWVNNTTALVGDACHPTLPHLAQGAAQAIEDAAVLGVVLGELQDPSPAAINKALLIYEKVRKDRAEALVEMAASSGRTLHLGSGAAKDKRDDMFAALRASGGKGQVPDRWADSEVQKVIYGHDCMAVAYEAVRQSVNVAK